MTIRARLPAVIPRRSGRVGRRGICRPAAPRAPAHLLTIVATSSYRSGVRAVGVKVLKNKLSEYVRLAESGETVLDTDREER